MTRAEAYILLNLAGIGSTRARRLLDYFGSPEAVVRADARELAVCGGLGAAALRRLKSVGLRELEGEIAGARSRGIGIVTLESADYPVLLAKIPDPPLVLYVKGSLGASSDLGIGIVGSRAASLYGLQAAERFAAALAERGFTIVSGMARGVDTAAHRGALHAAGRTIAVLGSGFDNLYPPENAGLAREIARCGAVISEFPLQTQPSRITFPVRNRIISGLSAGVVVVEAARNSGALITADCALEQGREVFALPGRVDCAASWGGNELIKQGAALVSSPDDVIEALGEVGAALAGGTGCPVPRGRTGAHCVRPAVAAFAAATATAPLLEHFSSEPVSIDALVEKTGMDISRISAILVNLQLEGAIKPMPGKLFVRHNKSER